MNYIAHKRSETDKKEQLLLEHLKNEVLSFKYSRQTH